jgi:hypothetical protein
MLYFNILLHYLNILKFQDIKELLTDAEGRKYVAKFSTSRLFSVVESISVHDNGTMFGYVDRRKKQGKASYMYRTVKAKS